MKNKAQKSRKEVGGGRLGIPQIAKLAGVSIGTVDRALHARKGVSKETRQRVLQIAKNAGYTPNLAARMLSVGRANVKIGVCIPREPHFFYDQLRDGILDEGRRFESLGVEVLYRPVERLGVGEYERMREMLKTDIQALIITPGDPHCLGPLISEAEQRNIRVVCVVSDAPDSLRSSAVCVDPDLAGRLAAELTARFVAPGAKAAVVTGFLQTEQHRDLTEGFCCAFPEYCEGGKVVEVLEGHEDDDETFQKCLDLLERCPDIASLYVNIGICLPVCYALRAGGLAGKVRLVATDLFKEIVPFFEKQTIHASIYQRPYVQGQTAVRLITEHALYGRPIPSHYHLSPTIVMRSNLYLFRETRHLKPPHLQSPDANQEIASVKAVTSFDSRMRA
ncbi:MAG: LacI family DNA-binding transcriptional regulator [Terriglobia bacterium]|jgi:LacI family transcriptional regulator